MRRSSVTRLRMAIGRMGASDREVYPQSEQEARESTRKPFKKSSTFVVTTHFIKSLFGPGILAMPSGFMSGGLAFSTGAFLALVILVSYNIKRLTESAAYLSRREQVLVSTYDEVAYVSFDTCSTRTRRYASVSKGIVNVVFIVAYVDSCIIFMIFVAKNVEALISHYFPGQPMGVQHFLFFQVILLMSMCSIRQLKYITPFSFVGSFLLLAVVGVTVGCFFLDDPPSVSHRSLMGQPKTIIKFFCIAMFSVSSISLALTLKSSMRNPEDFFSCPGVYYCVVSAMYVTFATFGFLGYLKYGNETQPSVMLNLPVDSPLSVTVKVLAISSVFLTSPLVFYVAFNVIWNNYLKKTVNSSNVLFIEFFIRYCLIAISYAIAASFPRLGPMIVFKGAICHSHLEVTFPAILEYVTFYPEKGTGRWHFRLLKVLFFALVGTVICLGGIVSLIHGYVYNTWD